MIKFWNKDTQFGKPILWEGSHFPSALGSRSRGHLAFLVVGLQKVTSHQQRDKAAQDFLVFYFYFGRAWITVCFYLVQNVTRYFDECKGCSFFLSPYSSNARPSLNPLLLASLIGRVLVCIQPTFTLSSQASRTAQTLPSPSNLQVLAIKVQRILGLDAKTLGKGTQRT